MRAATVMDGITDIVNTEMLIGGPVYEDEGRALVICKRMRTLRDETKFLERMWEDVETGIFYYEFDVCFDNIDSLSNEQIAQCLKDAGFYLENVETDREATWNYCGFKKVGEGAVRVSYYDVDTMPGGKYAKQAE